MPLETSDLWLYDTALQYNDVPLSDLCAPDHFEEMKEPLPFVELKEKQPTPAPKPSTQKKPAECAAVQGSPCSKKKKNGRACLCCAKAHAACDRVRPVCGRCKKRGYRECIVPTEKKRRRLPSSSVRQTKSSVEVDMQSGNSFVASASPSDVFGYSPFPVTAPVQQNGIVRNVKENVRMEPYPTGRSRSPFYAESPSDLEVEFFTAPSFQNYSISPPCSRSPTVPRSIPTSPTSELEQDCLLMNFNRPTSPVDSSAIEQLFDEPFHASLIDNTLLLNALREQPVFPVVQFE